MKVSKNFILQEFIDEPEWEYFGQSGIRLINPKLFVIAQGLRDFYGNRPIAINTWKWRGGRTESGLRVPRHKNYKQYSDHSRGNAFDCVIEGRNSLEIIKDILKNEAYFMALGVTMIEDATNGWNHLCCAATDKDHIWLIKG